jgi:uncharacterized membrane protein
VTDEAGPGLARRLAALEERIAGIAGEVAALDARLAALERATPATHPAPAPPPFAASPPAVPSLPQPPAAVRPPVIEAPRGAMPRVISRGVPAALILGWAGAAALVLAAAYLVRLGIEYGWITPARQVLAAGVLGALMVAGGLALRLGDRPYASLLSAGGIAVLYVAVFAAHLYHHLIGAPGAIGLAVAVAFVSLVLHALHRSLVYVAFALAGSYATPLLVEGRGSVVDLALYLALWDLVYCAYAVWTQRRLVVVIALYASLIVFDLAWMEIGGSAWEVAAAFQLFQFTLFVSVAVALSVRAGRPMGPWGAVLHFPALLLFYALEYAILDRHAPALVAWAAVGFALALYGAWGVARAFLAERPRASLVTIHGFGAIVLLHAVYIDATPEAWRPFVALVIAAVLLLLPRLRPGLRPAWWPYDVAAAVLLSVGYVELLFGWDRDGRHVADVALALAYPALLYTLYFERPLGSEPAIRALLLAAAHAVLLAGCAILVDRWVGEPDVETTVEHLWLSVAWAAVGVAWLVMALRRGDRLLARSTLGIFLLFGLKVLMVDLEHASPLVRVGCLAVLGVSLYAGGWIYRRVLPPSVQPSGGLD